MRIELGILRTQKCGVIRHSTDEKFLHGRANASCNPPESQIHGICTGCHFVTPGSELLVTLEELAVARGSQQRSLHFSVENPGHYEFKSTVIYRGSGILRERKDFFLVGDAQKGFGIRGAPAGGVDLAWRWLGWDRGALL